MNRAKLGHLRDGSNPFRFHDLRHTFGTLAVQVWPLTDVQAYMGHANVQTTMIYVHHVPKQDAADRLSKLVAASKAPDEWTRQDSNLRPTDYESAALTN
jgi:integrase